MTNRIVQALGDGAKKLGKTLGEDAGKAAKDLYHDTGHRLKRVADNHLENDSKQGAEFERLAKRPRTDETPVYHVGDDGKISRLRHDPDADSPAKRYNLDELTEADKKRIGLQDSSVGPPKQGERFGMLKDGSEGREKPRPTAQSTQVAKGSNSLARATQSARHAQGSYGTRRGEKFTSNNYAAAHVRGADGSGDFILVGRSHRATEPGKLSPHSERMVGTPFLRQGEGGRISELYTEREPCTSAPNCSSWMAERLPHVQASHSVEYGNTPASRAAGNAEMHSYLDALKAAR